MATEIYEPPPRTVEDMNNEPLVVPAPQQLEDPKPPNKLRQILPLAIIVLMVGFVALMFVSGARDIARQPMFMMPMMGMLMMGVGYLGMGGAGGGALSDINKIRKDYFLTLREQRKLAHLHGEQIHSLQSDVYPHPEMLLSRVGTRKMWLIRPTAPTGSAATDDEEKPEALHPWLSARVGVGIARALPQPRIPDDIPVAEQCEPVTALFYRRFLRTQRFVTNCPLGFSFAELPRYGLRGHAAAVLGLSRALIASLAFNHSPNHLAIGLITSDPQAWDWFKWLPHSQNRHRSSTAGTARLSWPSIAEFVADASLENLTEHLVVFVDTPTADVALPAQLPVAALTVVVLRCQAETVTTQAGRYNVDADRQFSTPQQENYAHADSMTVQQARLIAQKMARYRPPGWDLGSATATDDLEVVDPNRLTFFEGIGIKELDSFDPRPTWRKNEWDSHFHFPLGFAGPHDALTNDLEVLDFGEAHVQGAGPHGSIQGITGAGKSMLMAGMVQAACTRYSPTKVNFILMDFKGGATFAGMDTLPHVIANITNLEGQTELIDRMVDVIEGEIERREALNTRYNVDGIVEYRALRAEDPDKYPPYPEIFIVIDEFREYMETHRHHLKLLSRVGTVGRALGMHLFAGSQYIDTALIGDLVEHLTFGISLRTSTGSRSRNIVKTEAAKDLPLGSGAAILYRQITEKATNLVGFNVKAPYVPPSGVPALPPPPPATLDARAESHLQRFTLANHFDDSSEQDTPQPAAEGATESGTDSDADDSESRYVRGYLRMRDALSEHLSGFTDSGKALDLWKPSLRAPISYADITIDPASSQRLRIQIGESDAPRQSARLPYELRPDAGREHVRVVGRAHSGRSTVIEAMIAGAARAYSPAFCSFYVIDYGGSKLAEMAAMPNVGGYTSKGNQDAVTRFVGEAQRLVEIREREFTARRVGSLDQYFASRADNPVEDDPYGHFFLVIDGFGSYAEDFPDTKTMFRSLLSNGGRLGVHVVVTVESMMRLPMQLHEFFGSVVQLAVEDASAAAMVTPEIRAMMKLIPGDQPGRCLDVERKLMARIVVPQYEPIPAIDVKKGMSIYDNHADYSAGIAGFVRGMQDLHRDAAGSPLLAPRLQPAPEMIDYGRFAEVYNTGLYRRAVTAVGHDLTGEEFGAWWRSVPPAHKRLPLGISMLDLRVVEIPEAISPHLWVAGGPKSGRTSVLRSLINSIVHQYSPEQAQIVIIESKYEFLTEQDELAKRGYLLAYAGDKAGLATAVDKVSELIVPRQPTMDQNLTPAMIRDRSWWSGPQVFVIIDDINLHIQKGFSAGPSPMDTFCELLEGRGDLGMHAYVSGPAQNFAANRISVRPYKAFESQSTPVLLLSGPAAEGNLWSGGGATQIKFASRRPGQGMLVDTSTMSTELLQTPLAQPWEPTD